MSKLSTKIRQKQSIIPKQILQSSYLELSLDDIEKELENEIQKNPVLVEKNIEDSKAKDYEGYGFDRQESYDLFLSNSKTCVSPLKLDSIKSNKIQINSIKSE